MTAIAERYMQQIGFGHQPFLVYRHQDAGHPHLHIVSTNIERDGNRISTHNLGRNQSETARKAFEAEFNLVKAEKKSRQKVELLKPVDNRKIVYGKADTRRAISNVLLVVLDQYKYSSLPAFNAVLKLYNVTADRVLKHPEFI